MKDEKNIKTKFIVDEKDYTKEKLIKLAEIAVKYVKVSKNGDVLIEDLSLSPDNKMRLSLVARFIAHTFDENISKSIKLSEMVKILNERLEAVGSRMSQLVKSGFAKKISRGNYMALHYRIEAFLLELDSPPEDSFSKTKTSKKKRRKNKHMRGIGADIKELINDNFFDTPKTIKEVKEKLKEEVKFHDVRVIDATIRKTFVKSKKILKRIRCEKKGRARWQYVIRR